MKWSLRIARIRGIDVRVHVTFFLLLAWIGIADYTKTQSLPEALRSVVFILLLFSIVILHEFGHAFMARRFGVKTRDITLLPIGGVARLERMPERPLHELLVAIAGPAVNVVLAALIAVYLAATNTTIVPLSLEGEAPLMVQLLWINLVLAVFNMIPAFPMDGGRAFRAILAMRMDPVRATQWAASMGQTLAILFGIVGFFYNPILLFIAVFIWLGAGAESKHAQMKSVLDGIPVGYATVTAAQGLAPNTTLAEAARLDVSSGQLHFPIVHHGRVQGLLTHTNLVHGLAEHGGEMLVGDAAETLGAVCHPYDMLDKALPLLQESPAQCLAVTWEDGSLAGILTLQSVGELVALRSALKARDKSLSSSRGWRLDRSHTRPPRKG